MNSPQSDVFFRSSGNSRTGTPKAATSAYVSAPLKTPDSKDDPKLQPRLTRQSVWLADNSPNITSLYKVRVTGFDSSSTVIMDKHFRVEVAFGKFNWAILRTYRDFKDLHASICLYDKSAFSRLSNLFPLRYEPIDDPVTVNAQLHRYLVGLVDKVDVTLYPPLTTFLKADDLVNRVLAPQAVVIQKNFRSRRTRIVYKDALWALVKSVRLVEYNKRVDAYPRLWTIAKACALLRQPHVKLMEVHAQMSLADELSRRADTRSGVESHILQVLPNYTNSNLLVEGKLGAVIYKNGKWTFNQNRVLPMQPNEQYLNVINEIFSPPRQRSYFGASPLGKHNKFDNPADIYQTTQSIAQKRPPIKSNPSTLSFNSPIALKQSSSSSSSSSNKLTLDDLNLNGTSDTDNQYQIDSIDNYNVDIPLSQSRRERQLDSLMYSISNALLGEIVDTLITFEVLMVFAEKINMDVLKNGGY